MGNTVSFENTSRFYVARINEVKLNSVVYTSIFELGDLENIKTSYNDNHIQLKIHIYDSVKREKLKDIQYKNIKNKKVTFVIQTKDKDVSERVIKNLKHMIEWKLYNENNKTELRPRNTIKFPLFIYKHLRKWKTNATTILENTERIYDMKIVYLEKKQCFMISSNDVSANKRIKSKLQNYKKNISKLKKSNNL